ncbi:hypothetical protein IFR05_010588 [Cadophora sp. M221]|nr:hypothetical protein IFR05_010588 [Cadophora sp. M221]
MVHAYIIVPCVLMIALPLAAYTSKKLYPNINRNINPNIKPIEPSYSYPTPKPDRVASKAAKTLKGVLGFGKKGVVASTEGASQHPQFLKTLTLTLQPHTNNPTSANNNNNNNTYNVPPPNPTIPLLGATYIIGIAIFTVLSYLVRIIGILTNYWQPTEEELRRRERARMEDFPWSTNCVG